MVTAATKNTILGESAEALEQAEAYFKERRAELQRLREACVELGSSPSHRIFGAIRHLDSLYESITATMQEVRWSLLIFGGVRDRADSLGGRAFSTSSEWLASLDEEQLAACRWTARPGLRRRLQTLSCAGALMKGGNFCFGLLFRLPINQGFSDRALRARVCRQGY